MKGRLNSHDTAIKLKSFLSRSNRDCPKLPGRAGFRVIRSQCLLQMVCGAFKKHVCTFATYTRLTTNMRTS
jgi:hypothetical protein